MSWLSNLSKSVRETFENVSETVTSFIFGKKEVEISDPVELTPQQGTTEPEPLPEPDYPVEVPAQEQRVETDTFQPEEVDEDLDNPEDDVETADPDAFAQQNLRRIFVFLADAEAYAEDIPVPTIVFKRKTDLLYQVVVVYP